MSLNSDAYFALKSSLAVPNKVFSGINNMANRVSNSNRLVISLDIKLYMSDQSVFSEQNISK